MTTALHRPSYPPLDAVERYDTPPRTKRSSVVAFQFDQVIGVPHAKRGTAGMAGFGEYVVIKPERARPVTPKAPSLILPEALEADMMPFTPDPFADWIESHRAEMAKHAGMFVAIDPRQGIIGRGSDPVELAKLDTPSRRVMVTYVSPVLDAAP